MGSISQPRTEIFKVGASINKGQAVKKGSTDRYVVPCAANTDLAIGIAKADAVLNTDELIEVAIPGGGALALAGESISMGECLVPKSDGSLEKANALGDTHIAKAMEDAVAGDLFWVEVIAGHAVAADK